MAIKKPQLLTASEGRTLEDMLASFLIENLSDTKSVDSFVNPDPVAWILEHFRIPETKDNHIILHPYQQAALREALALDENGNFRYSIIVWSDIKKSIKSTIAAAVALWRAFNTPWGSIKIVANDLKQADSRVSYYIRRCIELNPAMKEVVRIKPSGYFIELPNHAKIEAIPVDPKGEAGGNDDMVVFSELWAASNKAAQLLWCYDQETEILTKRGWVFGKDLLDTDIVATVDETNNYLSWEKPRTIFKAYYQGEMHLYQNKTFSQLVTPEHRLYGKFSYSGKAGAVVSGNRYNYTKTGIMRSSELRESGYKVYHPRTAINGYVPTMVEPSVKHIDGTSKKPPVDIAWGDWCELMGWFLSEGNVKRNNGIPCTVCITQSPTANWKKWQKIRACLDRCFGESGYSVQDAGTSFRIHMGTLARELAVFGNSHEKYVPEEIKESSPKNLARFLDAYWLGDGSKGGGANTMVVYTSSPKMADDLAEIGFKLGKTVSVRCVKQRNGAAGYRVLLEPEGDGYSRWVERGKKKSAWGTVDYDGVVWCPSVSTGLVVVRRNGKVCVSGNTETTLSPTKYGKSFRWVETYAGYSGEAPLLEQLHEQGVKGGTPFEWTKEFDPPLQAYCNQPAKMFCMWNQHPRLSWQSKEYYAQEAAVLTSNEFRRVHRNEWVSSVDIFVPIEWWDACRLDNLPPIQAEEPMTLALDAAISGDTFGVVLVGGMGDGENYVVRYSHAWKPPREGKLDFAPIEEEIYRLLDTYNIIEIAYDPYQLEDLASRLKKSLTARVRAFNQQRERLIADKLLFDLIKSRRIHHGGDVTLREHVQNANMATDGDKLRIVKRSDHLKIDLAVATSMATARAVAWQL